MLRLRAYLGIMRTLLLLFHPYLYTGPSISGFRTYLSLMLTFSDIALI